MLRAFLLGVGLVVVCFSVYAFLGESARASDVVEVLVAITPGGAAFATAWIAPRRKFLLGLTMVPMAALAAAIINGIDILLGGRTDFPGLRGELGIVEIFLLTSAIPSLVGSGVGWWLSKHLAKKASQKHNPSSQQ